MPVAPRPMPVPVPAQVDPIIPSEKTTFPIYFTVVTDGPIPGRHNLLHLSCEFGPDLRWSRNITPQNGRIREGARLSPELIVKLRVGAIPVAQAMQELITWLDRFKGRRLPVASAMGFWHVFYHMSAVAEKPPFVSNPIDVNSFHAGSEGDLLKGRLVRGKDPAPAMEQRIRIVKEACENGGGFRWS